MDAFIVSAVRTPIGKFQGVFSTIPAPRLGAIVVKEAIGRAEIEPGEVNEVIMGNVLSAGLGQNPARQCSIYAGIPVDVGAVTINKVCGSGLKAVMFGAQAIRAGDVDVVISGGMENMSRAPYLLDRARNGYRIGDGKVIDSMLHDGLRDAYYDYHMGVTGDIIAEKYGIERKAQDEWALCSHQRAVRAQRDGLFKNEICPVKIPDEEKEITMDEGPRADTTLEKLSHLKPYFKSDGTVTPGNSSTLNDGASAVVLMSEKKVKSMGIKPMAKILGYATAGVEPPMVMIASSPATKKLLNKLKMSIDNIEVVELNEAFASQVLAVKKELNLDMDRVNVHGGAIAMGHPIGASGARILTTLLYAMKRYRKNIGLATMCLGGGNGIAMAVERC